MCHFWGTLFAFLTCVWLTPVVILASMLCCICSLCVDKNGSTESCCVRAAQASICKSCGWLTLAQKAASKFSIAASWWTGFADKESLACNSSLKLTSSSFKGCATKGLGLQCTNKLEQIRDPSQKLASKAGMEQ